MATLPVFVLLGLFITFAHGLNAANSFLPPCADCVQELAFFSEHHHGHNGSLVSDSDGFFPQQKISKLMPRKLIDTRQGCNPGTYLCLDGRCCPDGYTCTHSGCCPNSTPEICGGGCHNPSTAVCCANGGICPKEAPSCFDGGVCCAQGQLPCGSQKGCYIPEKYVCCGDSRTGEAWACEKPAQCCQGAGKCHYPEHQTCCERGLCRAGETCCISQCCTRGQTCGADGFCTAATVTQTATATARIVQPTSNGGVPTLTPHPGVMAVNLVIMLAAAA